MSNRFRPAAAAGLPGSTASTSRPTPSGRSICSRRASGTGTKVVPRRRGLAAGRARSAGRLSTAAPRGLFPSSPSSKGRRGGVSAFGGIGSIRGRPCFARRLGASVSSAQARWTSPAVTMTATMATRAASIRPVKRPSQIVDLMKSPLFPQEKSRPGNRKPAGPTPCYRRRGDGAQATPKPERIKKGRLPGGALLGDSSAGPAKVSSFLRCLVTPQAFADPRLACAFEGSNQRNA